jgi:HK97 family phage major capsid protein
MSDMLKRKIEEQNKLFNRMQEIQQRAEDESRDWTAEERTNWDDANARIDEVSADIERLQRQAQLDSVDYRQVVHASAPGEVETPEKRAEQRAAEYERAFGSFLRYGMERLDGEQRQMLMEQRATTPQATSPGSAGGYLIPPGYRTVITEALKAYGGLYNHANVITTATGNNLQWPSNDDTSNKGQILAENAQVAVADVTFGTKSLDAYTYTSNRVMVSLQLLQDSAFDLDTWLPRKLGERLGRITAEHFITGDGSSQPEGIAVNANNGVTAASAALTYDNLIDLEHSLDPAYRANGRCRFLFNDSTLSVIRKLKDTMGRPLWLPVPVPGMPSTVNGVSYTIDQGMANVGTGNKSVLFGDFHAGYIIRQVLDMQLMRLSERWADMLQVGYFAFLRMDAIPDDPKAVRALVHA